MKGLQEWSDAFDVWYNNIMSNQAPGLNEYEKSMFLTRGQDEVLKAYFNPKGNKFQEGFDGSNKRQIDFSMIMRTVDITDFEAPVFDYRTDGIKSASLPEGIFLIINERLTVTRGGNANTSLVVVPIDYEMYNNQMSKPYKRPLKNQAWRLMETVDATGNKSKVDLIAAPGDVISKYSVRYLKKPRPIVLANLEGVSIENVSTPSNCELDSQLHEEILQRAVELAKAAYTGTLESSIALGQASETNMGIVASSSRQ